MEEGARMSVVPLKQYSYLEWSTIAAKNNALRAERMLRPWSESDSGALWQAFFSAPA